MPDIDLLGWLVAHLVRYGPGVLFLVCLLETAIFAGLLLPVGALIAFSAMLATRGVFEPHEVVFAAVFGALVGDQLGFIVGRWFVAAARPAQGRVATIWRAALEQAELLIRSRGLLGLTVARTIPFVRTIMPWFSGRAGVSWPRFFIFDTLGVLLWAGIYVGGGFLAGEGWKQVAAEFGEIAGVIALVAFGVLLVLAHRYRRLTRARAGGEG